MIKYSIAKDNEIAEINDFFNGIYASNRSTEQFLWQFRESPHGMGFHIIARDHQGKIAGIQAGMPTRFRTPKGDTALTIKSEDTLVSPSHRGMGVFSGLYEHFVNECRNKGASAIWGYTKAENAFRKIGFDIPFHHKQALTVTKPDAAYQYFSSLDQSAKFKKRLAIRGMVNYAQIRRKLKDSRSLTKVYTVQEGWMEARHIIDEAVFSIDDDPAYIHWRLNDNPNWSDVRFLEVRKEGFLLLQACTNIHENGVAFLAHYRWYATDPDTMAAAMMALTSHIFKVRPDIIALREWTFDFNDTLQIHKETLSRAGWLGLDRGIAFVWMDLTNEIDPFRLNLTRLSTEGVL